MTDERKPYLLWPDRAQQLLLGIALRTSRDPIRDFEEWQESVDVEKEIAWSSVRLLPMAFDALTEAGSKSPLMLRLKGVFRKAWYENNRLYHRTAPLVAALHAERVDVLMLKGAPMSLAFYKVPAHRPMSDIDVMVRREQVESALAILARFGWEPLRSVHPDLRRFKHAVQCIHPDGLELDLHWGVLFEAPGATEEFWASAAPFDYQGTPVLQLSPAHALLHAIVHGLRCNPEPPIRWIPDSLAILGQPEVGIDWHKLLEFASRYRISHRLSLGLLHLVREYGAPVPDHVQEALKRVRPSIIERLENTVLLSNYQAFADSAVGNSWVLLTEYLRAARTRHPLRFVVGFSHFLRFQWGLDGRRQIVPMMLRGVWRRLAPAR